MLSIIKALINNDIVFGNPAEDAIMLNSRVKCSIPIGTKDFQNCDSFTEAECNGIFDIMNRFAKTAVLLCAKVGVFTTLTGKSSGVGSCISKLNKKSCNTHFHISCAGS